MSSSLAFVDRTGAARRRALLLLLSLAFAVLAVNALDGERPLQYQKSVVKLIDANFEHETQAYTGQTTGSWLLWFYDTGDKTAISGGGGSKPSLSEEGGDEQGDEDERPEILNDSWWSDHNFVLASVHAQLARDTVKRFSPLLGGAGGDGEDTGFPCFLFLHKGKVYKYDGPLDWNAVGQFLLGGYENSDAFDVPPPRGHVEKFVEVMRETVVGHIVLAGLVVVLFAFVFYTMAVSALLKDERKDKAKAS